MRNSILILFLISFLVTRLAAQNWQCIHDNTDYWYESQSRNLWAVKIDSVGWVNEDKTYYGFHSARLISDSVSGWNDFYCVDPKGPSQMGAKLSVRESGNFFVNFSGDEIFFPTLSSGSTPWMCCRITDSTSLFASMTFSGVEPVLGVNDSVKSFSFQARKNSGIAISHALNNKVFKVSKNFGMLTLYDFCSFPAYDSIQSPVHELAGFSSAGNRVGEQNLTSRGIYSMAPGDEFHIFDDDLNGPHGHGQQLRTIKIVMDSAWNAAGDTVYYTCRLLEDFWLGQGSDPHQYSCDTIIDAISFPGDPCLGLDSEPGEAVTCTNGQTGVDFLTWCSQNRSSDYNLRWVKENRYHYSSCSYCADSLVGSIGGLFETILRKYYIEGCGSGYFEKSWTDWYHDTYTSSRMLKYYRKGNETWGTPFDTASWQLPHSRNEYLTESDKIEIYPNPARDRIHFKQKDSEHIVQLRLINLFGQQVAEIECDHSEEEIILDPSWKGVYFIEILSNKLIRQIQKIIIL